MPASIRLNRAGAASGLRRTGNLPPITAFTMMAWIKVAAAGADEIPFLSFGTLTTGAHYKIGCAAASLQLNAWNGSADNLGSTITAGRWYHVAITVNGSSGSNYLFYLNGVLDVTATAIANSAVQIGIHQDDNSAHRGDLNISAIKIWSRPLAVAAIVNEMYSALPVDWEALNSCYPVPDGRDLMAHQMNGNRAPRAALTRFVDFANQNGNEITTETGAIDFELGPPINWNAEPRRFRRARYFQTAAAGGGVTYPQLERHTRGLARGLVWGGFR